MKQKKLIFNFFVNRNWKKLTDSRKRAKILANKRKSHNSIETLLVVQREFILKGWKLLQTKVGSISWQQYLRRKKPWRKLWIEHLYSTLVHLLKYSKNPRVKT